MRKLFIFFILVLSLIFWNCSSDSKDIDNPDNGNNPEEPSNVTLDISTSELIFNANGGEQEFDITCNTNWKITSTNSLFQINSAEGNGNKTITISVNPTDKTTGLNTILTIKAGNQTKILTAIQKGKGTFTQANCKYVFSHNGGKIDIDIPNNIDYQIIISPECKDWIYQGTPTGVLETKTLHFSVYSFPINKDYTKRNGYFIIKQNISIDTIRVFQTNNSNDLILTDDTQYSSQNGKDFFVELKTGIEYEITLPDWIENTTPTNNRTDFAQFHVKSNNGSENRSGEIIFKDKNSELSDILNVHQTVKDSYKGNIVLKTNADLEELRNAAYRKIEGDLTIEGKQIASLASLNNTIEEITGNLILNCQSLQTVEGLSELKSIGGRFKISSCSFDLTSLRGLNKLTSIGGDFELIHDDCSGGHDINSFEGLESLKSIGRNFIINSPKFATIKSFKGLNNLNIINGDFEISYSFGLNSLKSFEGLENLTSIGGKFKLISELESLESFKGLENLTSIGGNFEMNYGRENYLKSLNSFEGLENLRTIEGSFLLGTEIYISSDENSLYLNHLESFEGLSKLNYIGGDFEINASITAMSSARTFSVFPLKSFIGLEQLATIGGSFRIISNNYIYTKGTMIDLQSFEGLNNLTSIGGDFEFNSTTNACQAFSLFPSLKNFSGLDKLKTVGGNFKFIAKITDNTCSKSGTRYLFEKMESFEGLGSLTSIGGDFEFNSFAGESYSISYSLPSFKSFNGLENLKTVEGEFKITSKIETRGSSFGGEAHALEALSDFCALQTLLKTYTGSFSILRYSYKHFAPTQEQILNGQCSQTPNK